MTQRPMSAARPSALQMGAVVIFVVITVTLLWWAKWSPYSVKLPSVAASHSLGDSIITGGSEPPPVSLKAGLDFAETYFRSVWPALVAGLVIASGVQVLLPPTWLRNLLGGGGAGAGVRGGLLAIPSLMCTCCAAPIAVGLRRSRASVCVPRSRTGWATLH